MKRMFIAVVLVAVLAVFISGTAVAQSSQPVGYGPNAGVSGVGEGPLHDYMVKAMAEAFGLSPSDFEARVEAGKTAYQIALEQGFAADQIPALLQAARLKALDAALADKVLSQAQADRLKTRMARMGQGNCFGACQPMGAGRGRGAGFPWR